MSVTHTHVDAPTKISRDDWHADHAVSLSDSDIPATIARDSEVTSAISALSSVYQPLDSDLTAVAGLSPSNDDIVQRKSGAWANRTMAQVLADLAAVGTTFQPLDSDLTAIAALSTTSLGRSLLAAATAAAIRGIAQDRMTDTFQGWLPTSAVAENYPRILGQAIDHQNTSGTLQVFAGPMLYAGEVINSATFNTGSTGSATLTNSWFCLIDPTNLSVLVKSNNRTSDWGSFSSITLSLASGYTIPTSQVYYIGLCVTAGTTPAVRGAGSWSAYLTIGPRLSAKSTTGLTNPASLGATAAALTDTSAGSVIPYIYLS